MRSLWERVFFAIEAFTGGLVQVVENDLPLVRELFERVLRVCRACGRQCESFLRKLGMILDEIGVGRFAVAEYAGYFGVLHNLSNIRGDDVRDCAVLA